MHHTKEKGDIGLAKIIADLSVKGLKVLTPLSEHLPFDLVAYSFETDKFYKVQCKYKTSVGNSLKVDLRSCYASGSGYESKRYDVASFDILAIYSPFLDKCLYIEERTLRNLKNSVTINHGDDLSDRHFTALLNFPT